MKKLFDPDSPILRFLTQAAELAWLNILWVVSSLPVFTLGASTAALCTAVRNMIRESGHWNSAAFFRAFRDNFKNPRCSGSFCLRRSLSSARTYTFSARSSRSSCSGSCCRASALRCG